MYRFLLIAIFAIAPFFVFCQQDNSQIDSLLKLVADLFNKGDFEKGLDYNEQAEALILKKEGKESLSYAIAMKNKGVAFFYMGQYFDAYNFFLSALKIREKIQGDQHPEYAAILGNLSSVQIVLCNYEDALAKCMQAQSIMKNIPVDTSIMIVLLINQSAASWQLGNYENVESLYLKALELVQQSLEKHQRYYLPVINNLAVYYANIGDLKNAEAILKQCLDAYEQAGAINTQGYAIALDNYGNVFTEKEDTASWNKAELIYQRAGKLFLELNNPVYYSQNLHNHAALHEKRNEPDAAKTKYEQALQIKKEIFGEANPNYALSLSNFGLFCARISDNNRADSLCLTAIDIYKTSLKKDHADYIFALYNRAIANRIMKRQDQAANHFTVASQSDRVYLGDAATYLAEKQLKDHIALFEKRADNYYSVMRDMKYNFSGFAENAYDQTIFYKGFLLSKSISWKNEALANPTAEIQQKYSKYQADRRLLHEASMSLDYDPAGIDLIEKNINLQEKEIIQVIGKDKLTLPQFTWQDIQGRLQPGETAIEFIHYRYYDHRGTPTDSIYYAALILNAGSKTPIFVPLFEARQLERLMPEQPGDSLAIDNFYFRESKGSTILYLTIWEPLERHLTGVKKIYYSPSGLLHRINLAAVAPTKRQLLAEKYEMVMLYSTRRLAENDSREYATNNAVFFGGIQFDPNITPEENVSKPVKNTFKPGYFTPENKAWPPLTYSDMEIDSAAAICQNKGIYPQLYRQLQASEDALMEIGSVIPSPRILHVATHGFFFPDASPVAIHTTGFAGEDRLRLQDDPMLRSGLIMAGGNYAWLNGKPVNPDKADGILTAYEVSQLNLGETELVVLSACETALGDAVGNEGVYGLLRAFKIAGANYILMSLWQISDFHTREFMAIFYTYWLQKGEPMEKAFQLAQKDMKKKYHKPYYWAGFVLLK